MKEGVRAFYGIRNARRTYVRSHPQPPDLFETYQSLRVWYIVNDRTATVLQPIIRHLQ